MTPNCIFCGCKAPDEYCRLSIANFGYFLLMGLCITCRERFTAFLDDDTPGVKSSYVDSVHKALEECYRTWECQLKAVEKAILLMYNDAKPREYRPQCPVAGLEFDTGFEAILGEMEKRWLIEPTQNKDGFKLTKKGEEKAAKLLAQKR